MWFKKIYKLVMRIILNLNIKVASGGVITPPEPPQEVFNLDTFLAGKSGVVKLPSTMDNKTIVIKSSRWLKPGNVKALVGNNTIFVHENWDVTPDDQFDLDGCEEFAVVGITFVCPPNRPLKTAFPSKSLFRWTRDKVTKGKFAYIKGQEIVDKERVTFGLANHVYSSNTNDSIYLIAKDIWHNGFVFTQAKNPYNGNLKLMFQNVVQHNPIIEGPQSHYYSPTRFKIRIKVENGIAKIISNNTYDQILTWVGYNNGNQRSILHFGRYVYDISESKLIDNKNLTLFHNSRRWEKLPQVSTKAVRSSFELHPGDVTEIGTVVTKQIEDYGRVSNWVYEMDRDVIQNIGSFGTDPAVPVGEFDAFIAYKGNAWFSIPVTKDTKFGDGYWESGVITISQGYGWGWYNEGMSGYIENFDGSKGGYYRNSGGGPSSGLTIINSKFQENPPVDTSDAGMPDVVYDYIKWLESL